MMANKPVRCVGGCGRTQAVTVESKESDKAAFTVAQKWMCDDCQEKKRKREEAAAKAKPAPDPVTSPAAPAQSAAAQVAGPEKAAASGGASA